MIFVHLVSYYSRLFTSAGLALDVTVVPCKQNTSPPLPWDTSEMAQCLREELIVCFRRTSQYSLTSLALCCSFQILNLIYPKSKSPGKRPGNLQGMECVDSSYTLMTGRVYLRARNSALVIIYILWGKKP